jgi:hypothetical protein
MLGAGGRWNAARAAQNAANASRLSSAVAPNDGPTAAAAAVPINLVPKPNQNQSATTNLVPAGPNANTAFMDHPQQNDALARIDEIRARLHQREHHSEVRRCDKANTDYDSCNNAFKNFMEVLWEDEFVPPVGTIYTVRNVELFFQIVVANKNGILPKSAQKFLYAIEYHARRADPPAETTSFRTEAIFEALAVQEQRHKLQEMQGNIQVFHQQMLETTTSLGRRLDDLTARLTANHEELLAVILGNRAFAASRTIANNGHEQVTTGAQYDVQVQQQQQQFRCDAPVPALVTAHGAMDLPRPAQMSPLHNQHTIPGTLPVLVSPAEMTLIRHHHTATQEQTVLSAAAPNNASPTRAILRGDPLTDPFAAESSLLLPEPIFANNNNNRLPSSFTELIREVERYGLNRYQNLPGRRSHWPNGTNKALGKRLYLLDIIVQRAQRMNNSRGGGTSNLNNQRLQAAAAQYYDNELKMTLSKAYEHFKNRPGEKKTRQSRAAIAAARAQQAKP